MADGTIDGGRDMRYCYVASVIRWVLGGDQLSVEEDINVDKLVDHLQNGQVVETCGVKNMANGNRRTTVESRSPPNMSLMVSSLADCVLIYLTLYSSWIHVLCDCMPALPRPTSRFRKGLLFGPKSVQLPERTRYSPLACFKADRICWRGRRGRLFQ